MGDTGRDQRYDLPEGQQWLQARTDQYVWGNPATIETLGKGMDEAGTELVEIADSLKGIDVSGFWRGEGAQGFTGLRDRLEPAVRGLGSMQKDSGAALSTWKTHLGVYREDATAAITLGRQGYDEHQRYGGPDGMSKMPRAKIALDSARSSAEQSGRSCRTALEAAAAKADVPTEPPAQGNQPPSDQGNQPPSDQGNQPPSDQGNQPPSDQGDRQPPNRFVTPTANPPQAPSGQTPVPFTGPIPTGTERPLVDPANGRVVIPITGVYPPGQPWPYVYAEGGPDPATLTAPSLDAPVTLPAGR